jgi:hypothetical protein
MLADFAASRRRMPVAQRDIGAYRTSFDLPDDVRRQSQVVSSGKDWLLLSIACRPKP